MTLPSSTATAPSLRHYLLSTTVIVSALGYFVDIYDLVLFSIVRVASLKDLGVPPEQLLEQGVYLINMQMLGMLLGGIFWGVLGDKRGRLSVLFGSILMYSLANIANAFVSDIDTYAWLRLIAGIGLAGELGAAVTLVSESMPSQWRGYGTSVVAGIGVAGAIFAAVVAEMFSWQTAYIVGGVMGLALLALRVSMLESGLFANIKARDDITRGNFFSLFTDRGRLGRYVCCILIGMPTWYVVGILGTFSPEINQALGAPEAIAAPRVILWIYAGLVVGDIASGLISQAWRSRKKVVLAFVTAAGVLSALLLTIGGVLPAHLTYTLYFFLGVASGFWAIFAQIAAEQFGTNLRATVATTAPNFVRGSVLLLTTLFQALKAPVGLVASAQIAGILCFAISLLALWPLSESFGRNLDFVE